MSLTHKTKVSIARHLRIQRELQARTPLFQTLGWERRKQVVAARVERREHTAHIHALRRKAEKVQAQRI